MQRSRPQAEVRAPGEGSPEKVLVALDGSPFGDSVLPHARSVAAALDADLLLVTILDPSLSGGTSRTSPECRLQRIEAIARLDRIAAGLRADGFDATSEVREGSPPEEIVRAALTRGAGLVAVAARPRSEEARLVSRGVAQGVIASGALSLLVTRGGTSLSERSGDGPALRRLVVGLDGSSASHGALRMAAAVARHESAEVVLLHVVPEGHSPTTAPTPTYGHARTARFAAPPQASRYLHRVEQALGSSVGGVRSIVRRSLDVARTVDAIADDLGADLLVLGAHGAGSSPRRYGRCARRLLLRSATPLLLVQDRPVARGGEPTVNGLRATRPRRERDRALGGGRPPSPS